MRLIDADALIDELDSVIICENFDVVRMIRDMPTVDVFDKIRAEIKELDIYYDNDYFSTNNCPMYKCYEVLRIIDKYRG